MLISVIYHHSFSVLQCCHFCLDSTMREIVHIQAGQCGNQIGSKVSKSEGALLKKWRKSSVILWCRSPSLPPPCLFLFLIYLLFDKSFAFQTRRQEEACRRSMKHKTMKRIFPMVVALWQHILLVAIPNTATVMSSVSWRTSVALLRAIKCVVTKASFCLTCCSY